MLNVTSSDGVVMTVQKSSARDSIKGAHKFTHCNGDNHVIETCFKLLGYPEWHPKGKTSSPVAPNPKAESSTSRSNLATTSGFVAKSGISNSTQSLPLFTGNSSWIIDSGAIDIMTYSQSVQNQSLLMPMVCLLQLSVLVWCLSPSLSLTDTLFVPSLNCNHVSINKLTKSNNCVATFSLLTVFFRTSIPRRGLAVVKKV